LRQDRPTRSVGAKRMTSIGYAFESIDAALTAASCLMKSML
jgi:hypothetical protein